MYNLKISGCLGIIGGFLVTKLLQESLKWEEGILFLCIIITGYIHSSVNLFVTFVIFRVRVQPVLIKLIRIGCDIVIHDLNQGITMLKNDSIKITWILKLLYHHVIFIQQYTQIIIRQNSCIGYFSNVK